jgi:hypothetical protein
MMSRTRTLSAAAALLAASLALAACSNDPPGATGAATGYDDLVQLFDEFVSWRRQTPTPDALDAYADDALERRRVQLADFQRRLAAVEPASWPREQQVDYLAARAQLDEQEFILHVTRPWARDPVFYVQPLLRQAFTALPLEREAREQFRGRLAAVPGVLAQARANLTAITRDHGELAIFYLTTSDGVGHEHPYRETPPAGLLGWYSDLLARAEAQQPELVDEVRAASAAAEEFHQWLVAGRGDFAPDNGVGEELFDWFIENALLVPASSEEILVMAQRELERIDAFLALERRRNHGLPEAALAVSRDEYHQRIAETDAWIRNWLASEEFISIPDFIPADWQEMGFNVPWVERGSPPNFWEQVQYRDPAPDHLHAVIPGHRYDLWFERQSDHPIRRHIRDGVRYQGWAVYLEETAVQLGLFDSRPRTREAIYVFLNWRATRTIGDVHNQRNQWSAAEAIAYWMESTPWMDENVARNYAYLRPAPGHGLHYTYGHMQMRQLLADRKRQLGEAFVLRDFHDQFMAAERIPIALIRYEMTGLDDEVRRFWKRTPLADILQ